MKNYYENRFRNKSGIITMILFLFIYNVSAKDIFVSPTGNNTSGTGTITSPYLTIQKAAMVAVAGDIVQVRAGTYREQATPTNSGTAGSPITFQPYNNEEVTISGTEFVGGWAQHSGNIYKATGVYMNTDYNQTDQVFVNKKMMCLARWPNNTSLDPTYPTKSAITSFSKKTTDAGTGITTAIFNDSKITAPSPLDQYDGAEVYIQPNYNAWSWVLSGIVKSVVGPKITITSNSSSGVDGNTGIYAIKSRYYIFNKLSLLDAPGEWYHDINTNLLYLWCDDNSNPSTKQVEAKKREYAFNLTGKSYITIKGFKLFACSITTDIGTGGTNGDIGSTYAKSPYLSTSTNCIIDGIDAKYLSHFTNVAGHMMYQWGGSSGIVLSGSDHIIQNCIIQYSAGNGIALLGYRHKVLNNYISDVNYMANECAAINIAGSTISEDFEIGNNTVKRCGRSGIVPRLNYTSASMLKSRIHHNDISYCMLQDWDGGGIYSAGDLHFLRVDHNTIHESMGFINCGIYFDWSKNVVIDHNVVWNTEIPIKIQENYYGLGTANVVCYNNTLACYNLTSNTQLSDIGGSGGKAGSYVQNNICVYRKESSTTAPSNYSAYTTAWASATGVPTTGITMVTNLIHKDTPDPKFVDFVNGNLQLLAGSAAIDKGTLMTSVTLEGTTIPPYNDAVIGTIDIGAYEYGGTTFSTGSPTATATGLTLTPSSISLEVGATTTISAEATPGNAIINWSSGSPGIATVNSNGLVTGVSTGMVIVIATSGSITKTCIVTVTSSTAIVDEVNEAKLEINIYPNPVVNHTFEINFKNWELQTQNFKLSIFDCMGKVVYEKEIIDSESSNIVLPESIGKGLYIVKVNNGLNPITTKVLIE